MKSSVLIVDDEMGICTSLTFALEDTYRVEYTTNPDEALAMVREKSYDLCLLDLRIDRHSGVEVLRAIKEIDDNIMVLMMTAYGSIESSVEAIRSGAYTYLTKPLNIDELHLVLAQALEYRQLSSKVKYLTDQLADKYGYHGIIGKSAPMQQVFRMVEKLKDVDASVVISGESGTGKELVARALHYSGKRRSETFEEINCAAIPEGLLEGELFGYNKGAFTGASSNQIGKFSHVGNGTLFLDEIGDMPLVLQAKILRVLQGREFTPLGSNEKHKLGARMISATNKNLKELVESGLFRGDLYFRLNVVEIRLPALRDRKTDIPLLCGHFLKQFGESLGKRIDGISEAATRCLMTYDYPGNVRELVNAIEYGAIMCSGPTLSLDDLPHGMRAYDPLRSAPPGGKREREQNVHLEDLAGLPLKEVEKRVIQAALLTHGGHRQATAQALGISEKGLRNKITQYNLRTK